MARTDEEAASVPAATPPDTAQPNAAGSGRRPPTPPTRNGLAQAPRDEPGDAPGSITTNSASESGSLTFVTSGGPSRPSTGPYRLPKTVREFAALANVVATGVLNGQVDLEVARTYSSIARTVAQAITAETTRARFLKTEPDLTFPALEDAEE